MPGQPITHEYERKVEVENRFGSRSEAIRWLVQAAIEKKLKLRGYNAR